MDISSFWVVFCQREIPLGTLHASRFAFASDAVEFGSPIENEAEGRGKDFAVPRSRLRRDRLNHQETTVPEQRRTSGSESC